VRLTVDRVTRRSTEAISGQNLHKAGLFSQTLHSFLISTIEERLVRLCTLSSVRTAGYAEDGLVFNRLVPLNWLAVQSRAYSEREYHSGGGIGEPEGFVIASKSNYMRDHAEHWIVVHKEGIGFPTLESVSPSSRERVPTHGRFRFCRDLVFFKRSWRVRENSPVFLSRNTNRSTSP